MGRARLQENSWTLYCFGSTTADLVPLLNIMGSCVRRVNWATQRQTIVILRLHIITLKYVISIANYIYCLWQKPPGSWLFNLKVAYKGLRTDTVYAEFFLVRLYPNVNKCLEEIETTTVYLLCLYFFKSFNSIKGRL